MNDQQTPNPPDEQPTQPLAPTPAVGDVPVPTPLPAAQAGGPASATVDPGATAPSPFPGAPAGATATDHPSGAAVPPGPTATAYPSAAAGPAGPLPPRRGMPGWAIAAAVVGGFALLGGGFAGGLGTGLLLSRDDETAVQRVDPRAGVLDGVGELAPGSGRRGEGGLGSDSDTTPP